MSEIKLKPTGGGAGSVSLKAPAATTGNADVPFVLPVADGSAGQYLKTDGSKNLSFAGGGKILQVVHNKVAGPSLQSTTSTTQVDSGLSITITPTSTSSKIITTWSCDLYIHNGGTDTAACLLIQRKIDSGSFTILENLTDTHGTNQAYIAGGSGIQLMWPFFQLQYDEPATTGVLTYKLTMAAGAGGTAQMDGTERNAIATAWEIAG
tara:strand:- start:570 stop:1193 length:624 start_codon:yes stop_codon:yes gene_type:complete